MALLARSSTIRICGALCLTLAITGCAGSSKERTGGVAAGAACGVAAAAITRKSGQTTRLLATLGAAVVCSAIGSAIGRELDKEDRARMEAAAQQALATTEPQTWTSDASGASGEIEPTGVSTDPRTGQECRSARTKTLFPDGQIVEGETSKCMQAAAWAGGPTGRKASR